MYLWAVKAVALISGSILSLLVWAGIACVGSDVRGESHDADLSLAKEVTGVQIQHAAGSALPDCGKLAVDAFSGSCGGRALSGTASGSDMLAECGGVCSSPVRVPVTVQRHSAHPKPSALTVRGGKTLDGGHLFPSPTLSFVPLSIDDICGRYLHLICRMRN